MSENNPYGQPVHGQNPQGGGYGANPYGVAGMGGAPVPHPRATTVLVLGILGLVCCGLLAPVAWVMGRSAEREAAAAPGRYSESGTLKVGKILGIVGTVWIVLCTLFVAVVFVFGGALGLAETSSSSTFVEYDL